MTIMLSRNNSVAKTLALTPTLPRAEGEVFERLGMVTVQWLLPAWEVWIPSPGGEGQGEGEPISYCIDTAKGSRKTMMDREAQFNQFTGECKWSTQLAASTSGIHS